MLDERVGDLEAVVKELEEWTGELGMFYYSEAENSLLTTNWGYRN